MLIGERYKLESDKFNITLSEKRKDRWVNIAYFSNITNAFNYMIEYHLMADGLKDLQSIIDRQLEMYLAIKNLDLKRSDLDEP